MHGLLPTWCLLCEIATTIWEQQERHACFGTCEMHALSNDISFICCRKPYSVKACLNTCVEWRHSFCALQDTIDNSTQVMNASATLDVMNVTTSSTGGIMFTLTGQLNSVDQLLQAMMASADLQAAYTPDQVTLLQRLAANTTNLTSNPLTIDVLAALTNPVDAVALLQEFNEIDATPATTVAAAQGPPDQQVSAGASPATASATAAAGSSPAPAAKSSSATLVLSQMLMAAAGIMSLAVMLV